jgi:hypothetical protein
MKLLGKGVTSLSKELRRDVNVQETQSYLIEQFEKVFSCDMFERTSEISQDLKD